MAISDGSYKDTLGTAAWIIGDPEEGALELGCDGKSALESASVRAYNCLRMSLAMT